MSAVSVSAASSRSVILLRPADEAAAGVLDSVMARTEDDLETTIMWSDPSLEVNLIFAFLQNSQLDNCWKTWNLNNEHCIPIIQPSSLETSSTSAAVITDCTRTRLDLVTGVVVVWMETWNSSLNCNNSAVLCWGARLGWAWHWTRLNRTELSEAGAAGGRGETWWSE